MSARASAFTLVEVIVTVSIIAVLLAIVSPVLVSSRAAARELACLANIRQSGMDMFAHAASQRGAMPAPRPSGIHDFSSVYLSGGIPFGDSRIASVRYGSLELHALNEAWIDIWPALLIESTGDWSEAWTCSGASRDDDLEDRLANRYIRQLLQSSGFSTAIPGVEMVFPSTYRYSPAFMAAVDVFRPTSSWHAYQDAFWLAHLKGQLLNSVHHPSHKLVLHEQKMYHRTGVAESPFNLSVPTGPAFFADGHGRIVDYTQRRTGFLLGWTTYGVAGRDF